MSAKDNMRKRFVSDIDNNSDFYYKPNSSLDKMSKRLGVRGGSNQWIRMREDKLRSLKKALLASYQRAIVQKYDVKKDGLASSIISIITLLQDQQDLSDNQKATLNKLEKEYNFSTTDRDSVKYINFLQ